MRRRRWGSWRCTLATRRRCGRAAAVGHRHRHPGGGGGRVPAAGDDDEVGARQPGGEVLEKTRPGLDRVIDYGWFAILVKPLQEEANDLQNQRMDNVKLVLNKRWFAKRGKNVDLPALVRNVPGRVVLMDDPAADVVENNWPDVTSSSFS